MKKIITILLIMLTINITAQTEDKWFVSFGFDPAIASGLNWFSDGDRVGAGSLDYIIQFGREGYAEGKIGPKFGIQWEQFSKINFTSYGVFLGMTFQAPTIPFTNVTVGHYWYLTAEANWIDRKGIESSQIYNADGFTAVGFGINLGIKIQKPDLWLFKLPFDIEFVLNAKDRPDIRVHYGDVDKTLTYSSYIMATFNF